MHITELILAGSPLAGLVVVDPPSEPPHVTEGEERDDDGADDDAEPA